MADGRLVADDEGSLADRVEQWLAARERRFGACRDDEKLRRRGGLGPAEHGRGDIGLAGLSMRLRQPVGERDADRAHGDVDGVRAKR